VNADFMQTHFSMLPTYGDVGAAARRGIAEVQEAIEDGASERHTTTTATTGDDLILPSMTTESLHDVANPSADMVDAAIVADERAADLVPARTKD
jgi:hypothetical protein